MKCTFPLRDSTIVCGRGIQFDAVVLMLTCLNLPFVIDCHYFTLLKCAKFRFYEDKIFNVYSAEVQFVEITVRS